MRSPLPLSFAFCALALPAVAGEPMAAYGESYQGPKTLTVEVAPTAKGDHVLIKSHGVNHPWDGKVFLAEV
ncbi:hypothetical protein F11_10395 [Rhodospirillum rubrum F11]|uniref:Acetamidase n=2 Tax=Rhodospirillum rubrum TaxID=1085 RepID=Q2RSS3_RHORT|nr:hypothetical protein [Rhodospirillum rubrum]ABC22822.1 hypothetical protein Rru_A2022 [Rhodospirillum rubrum ATCC 11170]AEO48545.1 hypothetical protein F11_10395 [Rhodospirillum rubrum F11]MBK5954429.1 hypothetical protein [Rhodospirillum rubrum]QXG78811.1 hypothetical protein KUL73_10460 [Rhodospirillum rubrum]